MNIKSVAFGLIGLASLGSGAFGGPLSYKFQDTPTPVYEISVQTELSDTVDIWTGHIEYHITPPDADGHIKLGYIPAFHAERTKQENIAHAPPPPSFEGMFAEPRNGAEIVIDTTGAVIRTNRMNPDDHFPSMQGLVWQLVLPQLPEGNKASWKSEVDTGYYDTAKRQPQWPNRQVQDDRTVHATHRTLIYSIDHAEGDLVTIQRSLDETAVEKVGTTPIMHMAGTGSFVFDIKAGLVQSMEYTTTIEMNQKNVSVKLPVTVKARLLTADETTKLKAKAEAARADAEKNMAAAQAANRERMQNFATRNEDDRKQLATPPPTAEETAKQLKAIEANWQKTTAKPVDLLATMKGDHTTEADGTIVLKNGQRLETAARIQVPATFRYVVLTKLNDIRIGYPSMQLIFNWEMGIDEFRIDGGPAGGHYKPGAGRLPAMQWTGIEMFVKKDALIIYVDGKERYRFDGDFSNINRTMTIAAHNGEMKIKSITQVP